MKMALLKPPIYKYASSIIARSVSTSIQCQDPGFGLLFDIDGVLIRGKKPIPAACAAFRKLVDSQGNFKVPSVFVTNAGNALARTKSEQLSEALGVEITSEQVMMSHSPLRMFPEYHDKCVLLSGQGPIVQIAKKIGFTNTVTVDQIRQAFPNLDMVDHCRRPMEQSSIAEKFPKIDAIVLFGEPVRWETNLQLIIDVLLTHGSLNDPIKEDMDPHLPVLACNMDLLWMAESHMPRFGHGTFMHCLESVYLKMVGQPLSYTALMGKPSEITYRYADKLITRIASKMNFTKPITSLYAIGDNPMADIYGANLFNKLLKDEKRKQKEGLQTSKIKQPQLHANTRNLSTSARDNDVVSSHGDVSTSQTGVQSCDSVLVCTGVYSPLPGGSSYQIPRHFHGPRDIEFDVNLCVPTHVTQDVDSALNLIYEKENFNINSVL